MLVLFVAGCTVHAFGILAAMLGILYRYAIPRAPRFFHFILAPFMLWSSMSLLGVAYDSAIGEDAMFLGLDTAKLAAMFVVSQSVVWWTLVGYAVYHQLRGRHKCPV